jgi:AcrR family transcriptional regulator
MASRQRNSPRKTPQQERSRETFEAIVEAAAHIFERHGYEAGTTNRIAERAGVAIGSLYQYFPNKDAIVLELAMRHIAEAEALTWPALEQLVATAPPLRDGLMAIVWGMIGLHERMPGLHRVLFEEAPRARTLIATQQAYFDRATAGITDYLRKCPEVRVDDVSLAGVMVATVVDGITHGAVIHPRFGERPERCARETVAMLESYLTAGRA